MAHYKRRQHSWTRRPHTERRCYPRVRIRFPVDLEYDPKRPPLVGQSTDIGLGGLRAVYDRYFELFSRFRVEIEVPIQDRDGEMELHTISTTVAVVRVDPDEEGPEGTEYVVSLAFTRLEPDDERAMATFLLQMLLYDPDVEMI